jgi:hypothetical protein
MAFNLSELVRQEHEKTGLKGAALMSHIRSTFPQSRPFSRATLKNYCGNISQLVKSGKNGKGSVRTSKTAKPDKTWQIDFNDWRDESAIKTANPAASPEQTQPAATINEARDACPQIEQWSRLDQVILDLCSVVGKTRAKEIINETFDKVGV